MLEKGTNTARRDGQRSKAATLFPMFVKLEGRSCLVVGAGSVGESKIQSLLEAGAKVRVVAPQANSAVSQWANSRVIAWAQREFEAADLKGVFLVIAATSSSAVNQTIFREAQQRNVPCNSVDDPEHCDFYYPAVVRRGALQLAISTAGLSPALAQRLRRELEAQFGPEYAGWLEELGKAREQLFAGDIDPEQRRQQLHRLASREGFAQALADKGLAKGKVFLVGAGPGDPELLTLKALRVLKAADVVLHDGLVGAEILALLPKAAQVHNVSKRAGQGCISQEEINRLMVEFALLGLQVVRLKGGDPFIFGRAGEELEALRRANIEVEIVPGVTAALGAAASTQIPLTHRQVSSALIFLTGHQSEIAGAVDWPAYLPSDATVVIYMPGYNYENTARRLQAAGLSSASPCAIISRATTSEEQAFITTLNDLAQAPRLPAPTLLVVGEVVRFADHATLREQFAWAVPTLNSDLDANSTEFLALAGNGERSE
jgi:uroporphyrin-III C-methyltransferase/precorrin-2 dehydrogenase/sirohydrochlorin ferrochelatase